MRYKNTKTGAIIDSSFNIFGDDWEVVKPNRATEEVEEVEEVEETDENEEYVEEEIDLEAMTKPVLIEFAKEHEVEINEKDTKPVIIEAIAKALE